MSEGEYDWVIKEGESWPPKGRPKAPLGPTELEVMRSCPARSLFGASRGYERRTGYAARVGTAFHKTMQSLSERPPEGGSGREWAEEARRRFFEELERQEAVKAGRPRERLLPKDEGRVNRALESVMVEARRMARSVESWEGVEYAVVADGEEIAATEAGISEGVEVPVRSKDGLFKGVIDRVEETEDGARLIDYKSAVRDDVPERYERQLQLYALMWQEQRGEWPSEAELVYPFTGVSKRVEIEPESCEKVAAEYRDLIGRVEEERMAEKLATPGEVCQVCEFRPWCKPFWAMQAMAVRGQLEALREAYWGLDGGIESVARVGEQWKLIVRWRGSRVRVIAPAERFPQLERAREGMRVRVLEMRLQGQPAEPRAEVGPNSEIYLVER